MQPLSFAAFSTLAHFHGLPSAALILLHVHHGLHGTGQTPVHDHLCLLQHLHSGQLTHDTMHAACTPAVLLLKYALSKFVMCLQDRAINGKDCVVWHTFGVTHVPRQEDFPVMPVEHCGFLLKPFNFFDANPGLDIPPGTDMASKDNSQSCCQKSAGQHNGIPVSKL